MITLKNLDPNAPFFAQLQEQGTDPVTIITPSRNASNQDAREN